TSGSRFIRHAYTSRAMKSPVELAFRVSHARWLTGLSMALFLVLHGAGAVEAAQPNIVVILADDLGAVDLGCYGADLHETPRLDQFAKESVVFHQAYASAPVCSPTRAALM